MLRNHHQVFGHSRVLDKTIGTGGEGEQTTKEQKKEQLKIENQLKTEFGSIKINR